MGKRLFRDRHAGGTVAVLDLFAKADGILARHIDPVGRIFEGEAEGGIHQPLVPIGGNVDAGRGRGFNRTVAFRRSVRVAGRFVFCRPVRQIDGKIQHLGLRGLRQYGVSSLFGREVGARVGGVGGRFDAAGTACQRKYQEADERGPCDFFQEQSLRVST